MKKIVFIGFFLYQLSGFCQVDWTYYPGSPILSMDTSSFFWGAYGQPSVIKHNDTIRMWYGVAEGEDITDTVPRGRIHYAWSMDGITWTKYGSNPVLDVAGAGQWDDEWLDTPEILWDGTEYKLYYYGDSTYFQGQSHTAIGLATSPDGINWTRQGVVLEKGALGDWDGKFIESPAAYYDTISGVYALLYSGVDTAGWGKIGLTVSADGYNWIKYPSYPVMSVGTYPSWNDISVAVPALIETNGIFEMWYSGISYDNGQYDSARVGYAVSLNGMDWIQYPNNPVLHSLPGENSSFWAVDVLFDETSNQYLMYYEDFWLYGDSLDPDTVNAIFMATAPRDVMFSSSCTVQISNDTIVHPGNPVQLYATGGVSYQWVPAEGLDNPNIANPIATSDTTISYRVLVVSETCITVDTVTITVDSTLVVESFSNPCLQFYPNPAHNLVYIDIPDVLDVIQVKISDPSGKILIEQTLQPNDRILNFALSSGIYVIQATVNGEIRSSTLLVE